MASKDFTLTQEYLHTQFKYCDGILINKTKRNGKSPVGKEAGSLCDNRYKTVFIHGKRYYVHRIIYMMFYGYMPFEIDHIDRNKLNNRIENLRSVTKSENVANQKIRIDNKSGIRGISWNNQNKKWLASKQQNNKRIYLGYFETVEQAKMAVEQYLKRG